ncbi:MAG: amino acid oxidase, partial [Candidatus Aminicenantes bacterium]|nr:amino acid oxidase [Candidatus Aminicenantes bacterium]NIT23459.1 amino acid oxidase [Candidatus Aminicenantes bacterium]
MKIYRDENELDKAVEISVLLNELKIQYRVLDPAGVVRQEPALNEIEQKIKGGVYYPDDQSGDAYKFCV